MKTIPLGTYNILGLKRTVGIPITDSLPHLHLMGLTSTGKSFLLASFFLSLYHAGIPATLIDPHADLSRLILAHLVQRRVYDNSTAFNDILYLDLPSAERQEVYIPFNILKQHLPAHTIAGNFKEGMHRAFPELATGAANFDTLLPRAIAAMIQGDIPLIQLERFFLEEDFRNGLLEVYNDPAALLFFHEAFDKMRPTDKVNYAGSVMRRAAQINEQPVLRHSFSQPDNLLNFRKIVDEGKWLIVNLAVSDIESSRLLGCLITAGIEQTLKDREDRTRPRTPHYVIVDEAFQLMSKSEVSFAATLSETRKYAGYLCLAHQTWSQTTERIRGAIQNAGVEIAFRQGRMDSEYTAKLIGTPDMLHIKNEPDTGANPLFYQLGEEWESWTHAIQTLPPRHFYLSKPAVKRGLFKRLLLGKSHPTTSLLKSINLPEIKVSEDKIKEVEDEYLRLYFRKPVTQEQPTPPVLTQKIKRYRTVKS